MKRDPSKRARWKKKDQDNERGRTAIRYRAYPTPSQTGKVMRIAGSCRFVKNLAKEQWDLARRFGTRSPSYTRQSADLKELRDDPKLTPWLAEAPSQILQQAIRDTNTAYQRFFSGQSRYPTWAKKGSRASLGIPRM
ncbi:Transposase (probable), IS891/IS1136/IS1341 domain protein [mine drainage metagenome]|uniref:Transposase (Probable), IS891/IS1136/IS1341 domain protein n=1 Tax=mine drainage metagenome TaxID=410659 RepID=T1ALJ7_9ZZZZ